MVLHKPGINETTELGPQGLPGSIPGAGVLTLAIKSYLEVRTHAGRRATSRD